MSINEFLCNLGNDWLKNKKQRMANLMKIAHPDEALYREIMLSFGYSKNKLQFQSLALILPYRELQQFDSKETIEKALLFRSGLSDEKGDIPESFDFSLRMEKKIWVHKGVRPQNYPEVRMREISEFVWQTKGYGIAHFFEKRIIENFSGEINKKSSTRIVSKIIDFDGPGYERKLEIFFNILLPFYSVYFQDKPEIEEFLENIFKNHPPLKANSKTKKALKLLSKNKNFHFQEVKSAQDYFGLIHLSNQATDDVGIETLINESYF